MHLAWWLTDLALRLNSRRPLPPRRRHWLGRSQSLEPRCLLAVTVALVDRTLVITGDGSANSIYVNGRMESSGGTPRAVLSVTSSISTRLVAGVGQVSGGAVVVPVVSLGIRKLRIEPGGGDDEVYVDFNFADQSTLPTVIKGGPGNDRLTGSRGPDLITAGLGSDTLYGRDGNDTLQGEAGLDELSGEAGDDLLQAGPSGGPGAGERLVGGPGRDTLTGSEGPDELFPDDLSYSVSADAAADLVEGLGGNDTLYGNTLDTLRGGDGEDSVIADTDEPLIVVSGMLLTGIPGSIDSNESLSISCGPSNNRIDASAASIRVSLHGGDGDDTLIGSSALSPFSQGDLLFGGAGDDRLEGRGGDDYLRGDGGSDTVLGGDGLDYVDVRSDAALIVIDGSTVTVGEAVSTIESVEILSLFGGASDNRIDASAAAIGMRLYGGAGNDTLIGSNFPDLLFADALSEEDTDVLEGRGGDDTLYSGLGTDTLRGGDGIDYGTLSADVPELIIGAEGGPVFESIEALSITGGSGNNLIDASAAPGPVSINGGDGDDTLIGSDGPDSLSGNNGHDRLEGRAGDDSIHSSDDTDTLLGGDGVDRSFVDVDGPIVLIFDASVGGAPADSIESLVIRGGSGDNLIDASAATVPVYIYGNDGNDTLIGSSFGEALTGGNGDDSIRAGNTNGQRNYVSGGDGNDTLTGSDGPDILFGDQYAFGESGNDRIEGGGGSDFLGGGDGHDTLIGGEGSDSALVYSDDPLIVISGSTAVRGGVSTSLESVESLQIELGPGDNRVDASAAALTGGLTANGRDGNDTLIGSAARDVLFGGAGDDWLDGQGELDYVLGEDGDDTVFFNTVNLDEQSSGGPGQDTVVVTRNVAVVELTDEDLDDFPPRASDFEALGFRTWDAGGLIDARQVTSRPVLLLGGPGDDTLFGTALDGDTLDGGAGIDLLGLTLSDAPVMTVTGLGPIPADIHRGMDGYRLQAGPSPNRIDVSQYSGPLMEVDGGGGNDTLIGSSRNDLLSGGEGDDSLAGDAGRDRLRGGPGHDQLKGGAGRDSLFADDGRDTLEGGSDQDWLEGGWRQDGGRGDDTLVGGGIMSGGDGNDLLRGPFASQLDGGVGNDSLEGGDGFNLLLGGPGNDSLSGGGGNDTLLDASGLDSFWGGAGNDSLTAGPDANLMHGGAGNDTVAGAGGDDTLLGEDGWDLLLGDDGNDSLDGGTGKDRLEGGLGDDRLAGGPDANMPGGDSNTLIGDSGNDTLQGGDNADLLQGGPGDDRLSGLGGDDSLEGGDDNDILQGGEGNDTLQGDVGNDLLSGDAGNDRLVGGDGNDAILGGAGVDQLNGDLGNDTLLGGDDGDAQFGGGGADLVLGQAGNDTLRGNSGLDTLAGEDGTDNVEDLPEQIVEFFPFDATPLLTRLE